MSMHFEAAVHETFRAVVNESGSDGIDRQTAMDTVLPRIEAMIKSGSCDVPDLSSALWSAIQTVDSRDGAMADRALAVIASGQAALDLDGDPLLDVVVTLGAGRRKTWRHVTAEDIVTMTELRRRNVDSVIDSFNSWKERADLVAAILRGHHNVEDAINAGAFAAVIKAAS